MNELALLQKYEPVVRFTEGELFFPTAVDGYLKRCTLWERTPDGKETQLAQKGELSTMKIAQYREIPAEHAHYLRFVEEPLPPIEYQRWLTRKNKPLFRAPGRLTRVGLFSRLLDSFFSLSLIVRGKVPGGTAAAAEVQYQQMLAEDPRYTYYGRVLKEGGYVVLHYLFFYAMNNWRSGFYGVNDHEADWEQIFIYLSEEGEGELQPQWVAYASHDFSGDDLRRRWDDPELQKLNGQHPIVYAGAGSHAGYFQQGEYLTGIEPDFLRPIKYGLIALRRFWAERLGQGDWKSVESEVGALLSIPFVDYARGDGLSIGPEQAQGWTPVLLSAETGWVADYRGLWGLDTKDPFGGEQAPAGPKYDRDGSVRIAWHNPLGWAGLDKVSPPGQVARQLNEKLTSLKQQQEAIARDLIEKRAEVRSLALEIEALRLTDFHSKLYQFRQEKLLAAQDELHNLSQQQVQLDETRQATQAYLDRVTHGDRGDPQAHIKHRHQPEPPVKALGRIADVWAAVSAGLLLLIYVVLVILFPASWFLLAVVVGGAFIAIDALLRDWLSTFLLSMTIVLGVITAAVLVWEFWQLIVPIGLLILVFNITRENLRELRKESRRSSE